MTPVDISNYIIATPLPVSETNPVALELMGSEALVLCPWVVSQLPDGSVQFTAPTVGASSKSTHRTRTEWKEPEYWALDSAAKHWSRQTMTVTKVNSAKKVVIAQIHVKGATTPPLKVFWNKGKITMGFRESFDTPDILTSLLHENVPLGVPFKISIGVTASGSVSVNVLCQGIPSLKVPAKLDDSWNDQVLQFHGGVYNQIDYSPTTPEGDGSICIISELSTTHGEA
ncbi:Alginate lyase [compost metagenome]